jgi:hypothetical protein
MIVFLVKQRIHSSNTTSGGLRLLPPLLRNHSAGTALIRVVMPLPFEADQQAQRACDRKVDRSLFDGHCHGSPPWPLLAAARRAE